MNSQSVSTSHGQERECGVGARGEKKETKLAPFLMAVSQVLTTAAQFSAITLYTLKAPDVALVGPQEGRDTDTFLKGWKESQRSPGHLEKIVIGQDHD